MLESYYLSDNNALISIPCFCQVLIEDMAFTRGILTKANPIKIYRNNFRNIFTKVKYEDLNPPIIKCRNEKFIPGSQSLNFPKYLQSEPNPKFHAVKVDPKEKSIEKIASQCRSYLDSSVSEFYAILVKGLPISTAIEFDLFAKHLGYEDMNYMGGGGYREKIISNIYAASDDPPAFTIEPHNEMSYVDIAPSKVIHFFASSTTDRCYYE